MFVGLIIASAVQADVVRDGTVGPAVEVQPEGPTYQIPEQYGERRGPNLFHSFHEFSLTSDQSATFTGSPAIDSVISRVTGGSVSSIDGLIASEIPGADFFLINPFGVIFGENARLDVSGSFHATTANYLGLGQDEGRFDATRIESTVLSVAPPSAFGFFGDPPPSAIEVNGSFLAVPPGETLSLVGGDISVVGIDHPEAGLEHEQSTLVAGSGRIHLASVASQGEVIPGAPGDALDVGSFETLGEIDLSGTTDEGNSVADVVGEPAGSVVVRGGRLVLRGGAGLTATTAGDVDHPGTAVDIVLSGDLVMDRFSEIGASTQGRGDAGDIRIVAHSLQMTGDPDSDAFGGYGTNSNIGSRSFGYEEDGQMIGGGDGGVVDITTDRLFLGDQSFIQTTTFGPGEAGNIRIRTGELEMETERSYAFISSSAGGPIAAAMDPSIDPEVFNPLGSGNAGSVEIEADSVRLIQGEKADFTGIAVQVRDDAVGDPDGGALHLNAGSLELRDGAQVSGTVFHGAGDGGTLEVQADSVLLQGVHFDQFGNFYPSGIVSTVGTTFDTFGGTTARAGDIRVEASDLTIADGAEIRNSADYPSSGNAGDLEVDVGRLTITNSGSIQSNSFGFGDGGRIEIRADQIQLAGPSRAPTFVGTGLFAQGGTDARSAGSISVEAGTVEILDGASISTTTYGKAPGGTIHVDAERILLSGFDEGIGREAQISSDSTIYGGYVDDSGGDGGDIFVEATDLRLENRGLIAARSITTGDGGNLEVRTGRTLLVGGAAISVASTGTGNAGDISIQAGNRFESFNSRVSAEAALADGGNIKIEAGQLVRLSDSEISATVGGGEGNGGNVTIDPEFVVLRNSAITANAVGGPGGNILIITGNYVADSESVLSASSEEDIEGTIEVRSPDSTIVEEVTPLPENYLEAAKLLRERCAARRDIASGSFVVIGRDGVPATPDAFLPSSLGSELPTPDPGEVTTTHLKRSGGERPEALVSCSD